MGVLTDLEVARAADRGGPLAGALTSTARGTAGTHDPPHGRRAVRRPPPSTPAVPLRSSG